VLKAVRCAALGRRGGDHPAFRYLKI
jgi:hypothetical protein